MPLTSMAGSHSEGKGDPGPRLRWGGLGWGSVEGGLASEDDISLQKRGQLLRVEGAACLRHNSRRGAWATQVHIQGPMAASARWPLPRGGGSTSGGGGGAFPARASPCPPAPHSGFPSSALVLLHGAPSIRAGIAFLGAREPGSTSLLSPPPNPNEGPAVLLPWTSAEPSSAVSTVTGPSGGSGAVKGQKDRRERDTKMAGDKSKVRTGEGRLGGAGAEAQDQDLRGSGGNCCLQKCHHR